MGGVGLLLRGPSLGREGGSVRSNSGRGAERKVSPPFPSPFQAPSPSPRRGEGKVSLPLQPSLCCLPTSPSGVGVAQTSLRAGGVANVLSTSAAVHFTVTLEEQARNRRSPCTQHSTTHTHTTPQGLLPTSSPVLLLCFTVALEEQARKKGSPCTQHTEKGWKGDVTHIPQYKHLEAIVQTSTKLSVNHL